MFVPMLSALVNHEHRDITVLEGYQGPLPPAAHILTALELIASKTAHSSIS